MSSWQDLRPRVFTGALIGVGTLAVLVLPQAFQLIVLLAWSGLILRETANLVGRAKTSFLHKSLFMAGIGLGVAATLWLVGLQSGLLLLVASAWVFDVSAYFGGRLIGGLKLAPVLSPGKTWAGALSGAVALLIAFLLFGMGWWTLLIAPLVALTLQAGDLVESWMKRRADLKDSGTMLLGHGGWLDRYDGFLAAAPVWVLLLEFVV